MASKHVLAIDSNGNATSLNNLEVHTQQLNHWKGWTCWTGSHSLHIDSGGEVFRGTCTVGGPLGNIFNNEPIDLSKTQHPVSCDKDVCGCAFDYTSAKIKTLKNSHLLDRHIINEKADLTRIEVVRPSTPVTEFWVSWGIGLRCNYSCWYCKTHDNTSSHMSLETMLKVLELLHSHVQGKWERIRFTILGGEPTMNPNLLEFCRRAAALGHIVLVDSNASRTAEYYLELFKIVGELRFSIHLDYIEAESFYRKLSALVAGISKLYSGSRAVIVLKYMMQPQKLDALNALRKRLQAIPEFNRIVWSEFAVLNSMVPGESGLLEGYTEQDFAVLNDPSSLEVSLSNP